MNTNLASSFRPLLVGPAFIVDFRCSLCEEVDFCPAVFYTVCAASHLKGVVNLASPDVSQVTNVFV